jgi:hypothetical protein
MLDHRNLIPLGTVRGNGEIKGMQNQDFIALYTLDKSCNRMLAASRILLDQNITNYAIVPDITREYPGKKDCYEQKEHYDIKNLDITTYHHKENYPNAIKREYPQIKNVVLLGGGNITQDQIDKVKSLKNYKTVSVGIAVKNIPDYHVHTDLFYQKYWEELDLSETELYTSTYSPPDMMKLGWKSIGWFTDQEQEIKKIPMHQSGETVSIDALQFIFNQLKAEKVIMLGMEHLMDFDTNNHFWSGVGFQAFLYWYSKANKEIWNCTPGNTLTGCLLGSLEEAING